MELVGDVADLDHLHVEHMVSCGTHVLGATLELDGDELEDVRTFRPAPDTAVVTYGVVAARDGQQYSALMSSLYVRREDGWKLAFHQQTPR
jgi:hypothetical protein